jgi:hypothetical protein
VVTRKHFDQGQLAEAFLRRLRAVGPVPSAALREALDIGPNTLSRVTRATKSQILVIGKGKSTEYALRRHITDVGTRAPVREVLPDGTTRDLGVLHFIIVDPGSDVLGFHFESAIAGIHSATTRDLPFFLNDLRPAGFLGSLISLRHPELGFPKDIRVWSASHCLRYLTRFGSNAPGNLIVGDEAFSRYLRQLASPPALVPVDERIYRYPELATETLAKGDPGSSAGGEQPKFLVTRGADGCHLIVKFSPPVNTETGRRIADLLVCEHLALETLRNAGVAAADSTILEAGGRCFLEVERFDRLGRAGRRGVISLASLDEEFSGSRGTWSESVAALIAGRVLSPHVEARVRWLEVFGGLIANSDMHLGNMSFFCEDLTPTELTPVYDMTPWLFAPRLGEIVPREFQPPLPSPQDAPVWHEAWQAACKLWRAAASDLRISADFRALASRCAEAVSRLETVARALPRRTGQP